MAASPRLARLRSARTATAAVLFLYLVGLGLGALEGTNPDAIAIGIVALLVFVEIAIQSKISAEARACRDAHEAAGK